MLDQTTLAQLRQLRLQGFAQALQQQAEQPATHAMAFEERLALLVDHEVHARGDRKRARLLRDAQLKFPDATIENANFDGLRGLDRKTLTSLALSGWVEQGETILLSGSTGLGKTWLACALAQYACRQGRSALMLRMPRLAEELRVQHACGGFGKWLLQLAKIDVLVLDDWGTGVLDPSLRSDLLEIVDDRTTKKATIITHQLPVAHWHGWIGDVTLADAILDRLLQRTHRFDLEGESRRTSTKRPAAKASKTP